MFNKRVHLVVKRILKRFLVQSWKCLLLTDRFYIKVDYEKKALSYSC